MRHSAACLMLVLAVALAGCATTASNNSKKFSGPSADVAKAVSDLQSAGQRKDANKLCTQVLSRSLVGSLSTGGTTCKAEMDKAIADADDFSLTVEDVKVNGTNATATVRNGDNGPTKTLQLVREDNRWKVSNLG
jgi:hypothetical protein